MAICVDVFATALSGPMSVGSPAAVAYSSVILPNGQTDVSCTKYLLATANEFSLQSGLTMSSTLELMGIDAATILYIFSWGMGAVLSMWGIGYAVGAGLQLIRKV